MAAPSCMQIVSRACLTVAKKPMVVIESLGSKKSASFRKLIFLTVSVM